MSACTFFGHHEYPESIQPHLKELLCQLIEQHAVRHFYVGHQGTFDRVVRLTLREIALIHPDIDFTIVLSSLRSTPFLPGEAAAPTLFPEGIEHVPPQYAISFRNQWMLRHADFVVAYIPHPWGNASRFTEKAIAMQKTVFLLP